MDLVMQVPRLPQKGESVLDGSYLQAFGGKGANQAVAAARAGARAAWVGALGDDAFSGEIATRLEEEGIDLSGAARRTETPAGIAIILFDAEGENYLAVDSGANATLGPSDVDRAEGLIASSDWLLLQMEVSASVNTRVLELAEKHGVPVLLNFAPAGDLSMPRDGRIHGLVVNEVEASALLDEPLPEGDVEAGKRAAERLWAGGHRFVVVTLGKAGAAVADGGTPWVQPAFPAKVVDTTAAGDTFCGYLAAGLAGGMTLRDAVALAARAAARAVEVKGAQTSIPRRAEVI